MADPLNELIYLIQPQLAICVKLLEDGKCLWNVLETNSVNEYI